MNDRELLELAAKAAEIDFCWKHGDWPYDNSKGDVWNPLRDDGDALRLAVKLDLGVMSSSRTAQTCVWEYCSAPKPDTKESHGSDANAATRRAIVRAAAESEMAKGKS